MLKPILQEDDCAPDAREYFNEKLNELIGIKDVFDFITNNKTHKIGVDGGYISYYINANIDDGYVLKISADDPFYKLYNLTDKKDEIIKVLNDVKNEILA